MEIGVRGNLKIGRDTAILNMTSATDCPARELGLCPHPDICYARRAEVFRKQVLPYRRRQAKQWRRENVEAIAGDILRHRKIKFLRFSEAGDFPGQEDVEKMSRLAELLAPHGVKVYGYTARRDLDFTRVSLNMTVTGSEFGIHNRFSVVKKYDPKKLFNCPGNCRKCNFCKKRRGVTINVEKH